VEKARQPVAAVPWAELAGEGGHGATEGESQWDLHLRGWHEVGKSPRGSSSGSGHRMRARDGERLVSIFGIISGNFQGSVGW
jgi:hypothetical protein